MHTRRDQVEAHAFVVNRMRAALLRAEPDLPRSPLRRTRAGLTVGLIIGTLIAVVAAVLGLIRPSPSQTWRAPNTLILQDGTGSRFILAAGVLRPVLNYASARLLLGSSMKVAQAAAADLQKIPHGPQVGIAWAPETLPAAGPASRHSWLACSASTPNRAGTTPTVELLLDPAVATIRASTAGAVVVQDPDGDTFLVEDGHRWKVTAPWVIRALGDDERTTTSVRSTWLDTLPQGPDLQSLPITDRGHPGPVIDGHPTLVGEVLTASTPAAADRQYLVVDGGLMPIGPTAAALALGDPATAAAYPGRPVEAVPVSGPALASTPIVATPPPIADLPPLPRMVSTDSSAQLPCVRIDTDGSGFTSALVTAPASALAAGVPSGLGWTTTALTADRVAVPAGGGMLARAAPVPGIFTGALYLITQDGAQYPVADDAAATALGYQPANAVPVPPAVLAMLPAGPTLSISGGAA